MDFNKFKEYMEKYKAEKAKADTCPHCGYCKHCGQTPYKGYWYYPSPYYNPHITWTTTGTGAGLGQNTSGTVFIGGHSTTDGKLS